MSWPTISIVIPTYNEEQRIDACLASLFRQEYPAASREVIVVDNDSRDQTVTLAKKYPVRIVRNTIHDTQVSKMVGLKRSRGDLVYHVDADMEFPDPGYLKKLLRPLLEDPRIVGSFGAIVAAPDDTALNRFLTYDVHQRDPSQAFFSSSIWATVVERKDGYLLCRYRSGSIPPEGRCLYWKKKLMQTPLVREKEFRDLDNLVTLVQSGYDYFAYVHEAYMYHRHVQNLRDLIDKRLRNIRRNYLPNYQTRKYTWFQFHSLPGIIKIVFWLIYAHLFIPSIIRGCIKTIRHRDIVCIWYEPLLSFILTDITLYGFVTNIQGLRFVWNKILR